ARHSSGYGVLIDDLMHGRAPRDAQAQRISALCGVRAGAPLAVAIVRASETGHGEVADAEVARRSYARLIDQMLPSAIGRLIDRRSDEIAIIACSESNTARRLSQALRQAGVARRGNGPRTRIGISGDVMTFGQLPHAVEEARTALEFATDVRPVMPFGDI